MHVRAMPSRIGPYKIIRRLGRGGMGVVYLAEQSEPIARTVALKVIRAPRGGDPVKRATLLGRFHDECQALARMKHRNIAQVFDAGKTAEGDPYMVMEHIEGAPITAFADRRRLDLEARLQLFVRVCEGVQHAHQKGIIHRDLKPSNILVALESGEPVPKIIDFGVAKQLDVDAGRTIDGQVVGSPSHMSPEQLHGAQIDIDTRSDVYALGIVLFELLTGTLPHVGGTGSFYDYVVQLTTRDPVAPSTRCDAMGDELVEISDRRATEPLALVRSLRDDLDWIALKAVARDREARYPSASGLANDVRHYLEGLPVTAHPGGRRYRLKKLVVRNRGSVLAGLVVALSLLTAVAATSTSLMRALRSERVAQQQAAKARTVNRLLEDLLSAVDPAHDGRDVKVLTLIDRTAQTLGQTLGEQPEVEAALRHTLGKTYTALGTYPQAELQLRRALEIRAGLDGSHDAETLETQDVLAHLMALRGDLERAEALARETAERAAVVHGDNHEATLRARHRLADALYRRGRYDEAEPLLRVLLEQQEEVVGRRHPDTLATLITLGKTLNRQGASEAAEALFTKVHTAQLQTLGSDDPRTLASANLLANVQLGQRKYQQAEITYRQNADVLDRVLGASHRQTLIAHLNLATTIYKQGRYPEAERQYRDVLGTQRRVLGDDHPDTLLTINNLGNALRRQNLDQEAVAVYREALLRQREVLGDGHPETVRTAVNMTRVLIQAGRLDEAMAFLDSCLERVPENQHLWQLKADLLARLGRYDEAVSAAEQIVRLEPDDVEVLALYGQMLAQAGELDAARRTLLAAVAAGIPNGDFDVLVLDPLAARLDAGSAPAGLGELIDTLRARVADRP